MRADLDIYVEHRPRFIRQRLYILHQVVERMKRQGVSVRVLDRLDPAPNARAAFVHVDLTSVPAPFIWVDRLYPRCLNGRALSIERRFYSTARLSRGERCEGPVIVKSALNHRGLPDLTHALVDQRLMLPSRLRLQRRRREFRALRERLCPEYRIFESIEDVPDDAWSDSGVIVERFLPGTLDLPIVKHRYEFLLDCELVTRTTFEDLLCDPESMTRVEFLEDVPDEVRNVRRRLDLDFGSIDYFVTDGRVTVIDANKTTTFTPGWSGPHPELDAFFDTLAARLRAFAETG